MTIQYRNQGFSLTTSNLTTVLTIATSAVAIVKSISMSNQSTNNVLTLLKLRDVSAGSDFEFFRSDNNQSSTMQGTDQPLNLEAGDGIKAQAETANMIQGVISYALLDRSQENG
jgi:hypothetical protein|tara:strand:- start:252 stop:593 length:342 start_codon:yes stop_codon:yes gene_type:complete